MHITAFLYKKHILYFMKDDERYVCDSGIGMKDKSNLKAYQSNFSTPDMSVIAILKRGCTSIQSMVH